MRKSVFILSIHALCAIVLLAAQVLLAEVSATLTATVGAESDFPIALQGDSVEFWLEDMEIEVTGLPDNEYCIATVENISYTWMVNENVYGSGSQATVNSAAPGGTHTGHDTLETLGVHKIAFSGAGNVDVFYEVNAGLVHLEVPVCLYAEANFGIAKLILVTPHGDPINQPYAATGPYDGVPTCNEFSFDDSLPNGVLGIRLMAEVQPLEIRQYFNVGDVSFTIDSVGNAAPSYSSSRWSPEPDVVWRRYILCDATIIGLPANNSDFGLKTAKMYYKGSLVTENNYEVFFPKDANNHPACTTCPGCPNWFYYWKQTSANNSSTNIKYVIGNLSYYDYNDNRTIKITDDACGTMIQSWGTPKGIDSFAWVTAHENKHHLQTIYFWPISYNPAEDQDSDWIKDSLESTYMPGRPYDNQKRATYPDEVGYGQNPLNDIEDICMRSQVPPYGIDILWQNGSADSEDWANPGKQSQNKF